MEIIKSLNLNVTPKDAPNGSLVYARNVMTDDTSSFLTNDIGFDKVLDFGNNEKIVGIIPCSKEIVIFTFSPVGEIIDDGVSKIYRFPDGGNPSVDLKEIESSWKWSGGKIDGTYTYNYKNELIIAIGEYGVKGKDIPLKSINLDTCNDNGFTYAIEELIPKHSCEYAISTNGNLVCGTYTFFIRYKVDDYNYTKWFQVTSDIHVTNIVDKGGYIHKYLNSNGGEETIIKDNIYVNDDNISPYSITLRFDFEKIEEFGNSLPYTTFQLGYIIKRKSDVQGRIKAEFSIKENKTICVISDNFYNAEISIDELLENPNQKFNVENIINYNNRLYIANYKEYEIKEEDGDVEEGVINISIDSDPFGNPETDEQGGETITVNVVDFECKIWNIIYGSSESVRTTRYTEHINFDGLRINVQTHYLTDDSKTQFLNILKDYIYCLYKDTSTEFVKFSEDNGPYNHYLFVQNVVNNDGSDAICILQKINDSNVNPSNGWDWDFALKTFDIYVTPNEISIKYNDGTNLHTYILWKDNTEEDNARISILSAAVIDNEPHWIFGGDYYIGASPYDCLRGTPMHRNIKITSGIFTNSGDQDDESDDDDYSFGIDVSKYKNRSLVPYQNYNFFIHYIRKDGSYTLGYPIGIKNCGVTSVNSGVKLVPKFNITSLPSSDYIGYFISYEDITVNSQSIWILKGNGTNGSITSVEFIYDTDFISGSKIAEYDGKMTDIVSNSINILMDRLNCNRIGISTVNPIDEKIPAFITREISNQYSSENKILFRLTKDIYELNKEIKDSDYLPGYLNSQYFFVFDKNIILDPFVSNVFDGKTGEKVSYDVRLEHPSLYTKVPIYAMNIKADYLKASVILEKVGDATDLKDTDKIDLIVNKVVPPSALHDFLELQPAYSAKPSKIFTNFRKAIKDKFDKTICRSDVISDESLVNGFRHFESSQYKNILENKGKITNIVAIGLYLIIHTEYSIFVFDRSPKLSQYAQTEIPDAFGVDYQELMPTDEGYGGLANKEESIITKRGYIWYDRNNKIIFSFDKGQPAILSSYINNYIHQLPIVNCRFAEDILHNRLIVCFELKNRKYLTLSYNFASKQFISFHDYKFTHNFKTYTKSYIFDADKPSYLFAFNDRQQCCYHELGLDNNHLINIGDISYGDLIHPSIIDIIFNEGYELPKVLNSINYILSKFNHVERLYLPQILREYDDRLFSGDYLRIYTDEIITDIINLRDNKDTVNSYNVYDKPKWEKGKWNLNYFRDTHHIKEENISDEKSLVYGKYFVIRFIFENNVSNPTRFKLDNVNVNTQLY